MENNFSSSSSSINTAITCKNNTNTTFRPTSMAYTHNSQFSNPETMPYPSTSSTNTLPHNFFPVQYLPPYYHPQAMQIPSTFPLQQQPGQAFAAYPVYPFRLGPNAVETRGAGNNNAVQVAGQWFMQPNVVLQEQQRGVLDPQMTKIARIKRKLARQRSLSLQRNASSGASSSVPSPAHPDARRPTMYDANRDLYKFCTPDNKRLRMLLKKELKNSDVGSLGRIVLPKREAEENLPSLYDKEGIQLVLRDVYSDQVWTLKFKYWSNNKSRMYVLENTGDFVRQNKLEIGDSLTLYEDENKILYFSIKKVERPAAEPSYQQHYPNQNQTYNNAHNPIMQQARDEEDASLALLIEQLKHKEQQEAHYNLMTLSMDETFSRRQPEEANKEGGSSSNVNTNPGISLRHGRMKNAGDHQTVDDCYGGLDMLPDVNRYNFSLSQSFLTKGEDYI